jgi:signal transduction histidine kinase
MIKGMMGRNELDAQIDAATDSSVWVRLGWLWSALFYLTLFVPAGLALRDVEFSGPAATRIVGLTIVFALWHLALLLYIYRYPDFRSRPSITLTYLAVSLVLWWLLIQTDQVFYIMLTSLYPQIFAFLPIYLSIPGSLLLTVLSGYGQVSESEYAFSWTNPGLWVGAVSFVGSSLLALWIYSLVVESNKRRELLKALQRAQGELATAERNAGMLAERQRLAREIHDTLAQGFTSIVIHLEAAEQALPAAQTTARHHLDQARQIARHSLGEARRVVQDLRPELLEQEPLPQAIARVVSTWATQSGAPAMATTTGVPVQLHPQVEATLLRAVQEALANVQKHARATETAVTLSYMDNVVMLDVQDNGVGLSAGAGAWLLNAGGFGFTTTCERVEGLKGTLLIESEPGEGTTLVVEIPIANS